MLEHVMLRTDSCLEQAKHWPRQGQHILAQFDEHSIIVYQAYRPSIGRFVIEYGQFGGDFSFSRMSWIKPNFLWMMYRSGWGTKEGQEITLGLRLRREFFDSLLAQAIQSTYNATDHATRKEWQHTLAKSMVRLQWDPDHDPAGTKLDRRAIQLGLRGTVLEAFARHELLEVIDLTAFVAEQRQHAASLGFLDLRTPVERVYCPADSAIGVRLRLANFDSDSPSDN
jgi:hypothetical protein